MEILESFEDVLRYASGLLGFNPQKTKVVAIAPVQEIRFPDPQHFFETIEKVPIQQDESAIFRGEPLRMGYGEVTNTLLVVDPQKFTYKLDR